MAASIKVKQVTQLLGHKSAIYSLDQVTGSTKFLSAAGEGWIVEWDLLNPKDGVLLAQANSNIFAVKTLKNGLVLCGNRNGGLHIMDPAEKKEIRLIDHHKKGIFGIVELDESLITIGGAGLISTWKSEGMILKESMALSHKSIRGIAIHPYQPIAALGASDQNIYFVDLHSMQHLNTIEKAHNNSVFALQFSKNGQQLISGGRDARLKVWELPESLSPGWQPEPIKSIPAHWYTINAITFHPKLNIFATASRDKTIKIWDGTSYDLLKVIDFEKHQGHVNSVNDLLWSPFENYLISCSDDRRIIIWEIQF